MVGTSWNRICRSWSIDCVLISRVFCSNWTLTDPFLPCSEDMVTIDILFANLANKAAEFNSLAYQSPPPITNKQIRSRMIYNSHLYGNGNQGHEFTQSLTDSERYAIIEYLKTL